MSAYADDPRVTRNRTSDESYDIDAGGQDWIVVQGDNRWFAKRYNGKSDDKGPYQSPDEAIRSLIGDPQ
jgi:hypothetical protein